MLPSDGVSTCRDLINGKREDGGDSTTVRYRGDKKKEECVDGNWTYCDHDYVVFVFFFVV